MFYFFFQAEDGIRDGHVTGVQTCALPISPGARRGGHPGRGGARVDPVQDADPAVRRSEERRVGKECRSRRERYCYRKRSLEIKWNNHLMRQESSQWRGEGCISKIVCAIYL